MKDNIVEESSPRGDLPELAQGDGVGRRLLAVPAHLSGPG